MAISREILTAALGAFKVERQKIDANIRHAQNEREGTQGNRTGDQEAVGCKEGGGEEVGIIASLSYRPVGSRSSESRGYHAHRS
jgi:hypothetical protein